MKKYLTLSIDKRGKVLRCSPSWQIPYMKNMALVTIEVTVDNGYITSYAFLATPPAPIFEFNTVQIIDDYFKLRLFERRASYVFKLRKVNR